MPSNNPAIYPMARKTFVILAVCIACIVGPMPARAEDTTESPAPAGAKASAPSAMVSLINRLAARGLLTKQDAEDLNTMAEADAADARVEAAEARLAIAKAEAAAARARAALARATAELALARSDAAQVSANQAAAVRLLLGQGKAVVTPAAASSEKTVSMDQAIAVENTTVAASTQDSDAVAQPSAATQQVVQDTNAMTGAAPVSAADSPLPSPAAEAPAAQEVAVSAENAPIASTDAQPSPSPALSANSPEPSAAMNLTRNEEGAIVVPEEADAVQTKSTAVPSDTVDSSAGAAPDAGTSESSKAEDSTTSDLGASSPQEGTASAAAASMPDTASSEPASFSVQSNAEVAAADTTQSSGRSSPPKTAAEAPSATAEAAPDAAAVGQGSSDDVVRVAYVPEVVKKQIRDEVKSEVIAEARKENWGAPSSGPEWVSKFTLYGDIRIRAEEVINHGGNDDTGAFPNFNAINTGAPFDTAGSVFSPQYNVDQNRNRERLRARLGFAVDVSGGFTAGIRIATGNDNNPVTENQTFGAAGNAQGGDFAKYSLWLDRAFIKYRTAGDLEQAFWMSLGRFDNPFFSSSLIWANDIGFDGIAASIPLKTQLSGHPTGDFKPFLVVGAFPIFNTDLNYATNSPVKFKSYDKWLYAGQLGFDAKISDDFSLKAAAALYEYKNVEGHLSSPFTPLTTSDAGDTDASRPSFAQNGNTYMAIRDIVPGPLNNNGTIDQFQYYGLATPFREFAVTEGLYFNHFEPFQISLVSEWVKNLAFNRAAVAAVAVNNGGTSNFIGGNTGWMTTLKFGSASIKEFGDWSASIGYRKVESDAVVDGFNDADFGGVLLGTNLKGYTVTASFALAHDVWIDTRLMSASSIAGPIYKNDLFQLDLNTRF